MMGRHNRDHGQLFYGFRLDEAGPDDTCRLHRRPQGSRDRQSRPGHGERVARGKVEPLVSDAHARFTRLTNAHSKKFENHCHIVALYTVWYNFVRTNSAVRMPPAMAAAMRMEDIVTVMAR